MVAPTGAQALLLAQLSTAFQDQRPRNLAVTKGDPAQHVHTMESKLGCATHGLEMTVFVQRGGCLVSLAACAEVLVELSLKFRTIQRCVQLVYYE